MDVEIGPAGPADAAELTAVHRAAAHLAFAGIFPADAPPPRYEDDLAKWEHWLGPDRRRGRRAHVARLGGSGSGPGSGPGTEPGSGSTTRPRTPAVGVVLTGPDPDEPAAGHLARLYVLPAHWGRGVGTRLYRTAMDDLTARRFPEATLWVLEGNDRARRWYERLGWRLSDGRKTTYAPAGIEDVQYRIALPPREA